MSKYSENMPPDIEGAIGWLIGYIKSNTNFLDVGCSTGYFGDFIKTSKNITVDGVEISEDIVEAKKKLDEVFSFDVDMPWPKLNKKYDYIYFGDVLGHLKDPSAALIQASNHLKKDGIIFVSIPNIAHVSVRLELLRGSFRYEPTGILDNTHLQYFTKDTFVDTAREAGFGAELVDYTENDLPKEIVEQYLKKAGLTAAPAFWDITHSIESRAYQFKFVLRPSKVSTRPQVHALDKPLRYRDDYLKSFQDQLDNLHAHANEQAKIIKHYVDLSQHLEVENQQLKAKLLIRLEGAVKRRIKRKRV